MPLMLVDLDNTLIDRDAAFQAAVAAFLAEYGLPGTDLAWVMGANERELFVLGGFADRGDQGRVQVFPGAEWPLRCGAGGDPPHAAAASIAARLVALPDGNDRDA